MTSPELLSPTEEVLWRATMRIITVLPAQMEPIWYAAQA
jgi:hypothetical protein